MVRIKQNMTSLVGHIIVALCGLIRWFICWIFRCIIPSFKSNSSHIDQGDIGITVTNPTINNYEGLTSQQIEASELASDAVKLKDFKLNDAIQLLRKATALWPENLEISFRLARYLREAKLGDEAFTIYRKLSLALVLNDYLFYGFKHASIYEEMMKQVYEEKKFNYYLYYYFHNLWFTLIGLSAQGRYTGIDPEVFLTYGAQTKIGKALKAEGLIEKRPILATSVYEALLEYHKDLLEMSSISKANEFPTSDEVPSGGSLGERHLAVLKKNREFVQLFKLLTNPMIPDKIYKKVFASNDLVISLEAK